MAIKVDEKTHKRLLELKALGLTDKVISLRLGIAERTVRIYTRAARTNSAPYSTPEASEVVPSRDSSEAAE